MKRIPAAVGIGMTLLLAGCGAGTSVVSGSTSTPGAGSGSGGASRSTPTPAPPRVGATVPDREHAGLTGTHRVAVIRYVRDAVVGHQQSTPRSRRRPGGPR